MTTAYIGIGSNVGERLVFCREAVAALDDTDGIRVTAASGLYETTPVGGPPQRSFINLVARLETTLGPRDLLAICQSIERTLGREPSDIRWGPRVIDLDVLVFGDQKVNEGDLEIPHPRMTQRRFVLVPLLEIDPDAADPWGSRYADWVDEAEGEVHLVEPF
ncbi:MAG: 2-amino-4-hydroxy-6-hydroxymethyldihydropteridine diphosphokinase [Actinomycetota bacterium]|nr:2-amino-4-hydroxy-6-hydroxymethyldihydropteridine diphosphokinase [Actinomycetota bacterium]